jgi:hypothetical protein
MSGSDFFDEDLSNRGASRRQAPGQSGGDPDGNGGPLNRPVSDLNLTRMTKQREELEHQVAASAHELDRLRMRTEELARERSNLEELRHKQVEYIQARRDLTDRLNQSLVMMEKEQIRAEAITELLMINRDRFKAMEAEIEAIDDESWPDDQVRDELTKSIALLDECRLEYNSATAKIDAAVADGGNDVTAPLLRGKGGKHGWPGFGYWLKAGLAASLPLLLFLLAVAVAWFLLHRYKLL